jgi:hypothetical protein
MKDSARSWVHTGAAPSGDSWTSIIWFPALMAAKRQWTTFNCGAAPTISMRRSDGSARMSSGKARLPTVRVDSVRTQDAGTAAWAKGGAASSASGGWTQIHASRPIRRQACPGVVSSSRAAIVRRATMRVGDCMAFRSLLTVAVAFVLVQSHSHAQTRPNFSGTWTLTTKPGVCPGSMTLLQDESSLRVQSGDVDRARIYRFDGTDTHEALAPAPARPVDMPPTAYHAHKTRSVARAAWNGDQFVIVTHATMTMTWPSHVPDEFDRETTSRDVYSFNEAGQLMVERRIVVDPLPGGTPRRIDLPDSWTCVYARAGESKLAPSQTQSTQATGPFDTVTRGLPWEPPPVRVQ